MGNIIQVLYKRAICFSLAPKCEWTEGLIKKVSCLECRIFSTDNSVVSAAVCIQRRCAQPIIVISVNIPGTWRSLIIKHLYAFAHFPCFEPNIIVDDIVQWLGFGCLPFWSNLGECLSNVHVSLLIALQAAFHVIRLPHMTYADFPMSAQLCILSLRLWLSHVLRFYFQQLMYVLTIIHTHVLLAV